MTTLFRWRVTVFCTVIAMLFAVVGWSAFMVWNELGTLRRRFTDAEFQSFRIAGELQSSTREVNSALLAYALSGADTDWQRFQTDSHSLNAWIDLQRNALRTAGEKRVLADIDAEYDRYLAVGNSIRQKRDDRAMVATTLARQLDEPAKRMFSLAERLAEAHRAALGEWLGESQRSLRKLESIFGGCLVLMVSVSAWGGWLYFEDKITPLRLQLIEVQQVAAQHEKLASLGVLAAGVAHEIRNPLTALKARVFTLRRKLAPDVPAMEDAAIIDQEIDRLERIVGDFLRFARPSDPEFVVVPAETLLSAVRDLLAPELEARDITLQVEPDRHRRSVRVDPHQLEQVFINLIRNAAESIEHDGRITLRVKGARLPLAGSAQEVILIEVEDTGTGIPAEVQDRLFDPFFSTKPAGTGLGLSIAMRILERHGGTLQFQTAPGRGTTFGVVLPVELGGCSGASGSL